MLEDSGPGEVDPIVEGVQFKVVYNHHAWHKIATYDWQVKYLGSCPVSSDSGEEVTANAIKAILATAKRLEKKLARVEVVTCFASLHNMVKLFINTR